ncbi:1,4-alpha-glucan branching protein GlgB [Candidatus Methylospira mobilis]|uniref:1,4-alpha-glucan branching protein GlgB n=1 Tax=Candidatus Methylospira mobilis TaxID=1808979 RepID=UPI001D178251|nr:1,4-alpha-glucan branching protein GlgB [Candidatus Methylospira mobilis]WNV06661.1 1,4-alpha-glucan branching protein GlgB [Candidatus Methylospira mobilis]
MNLTNSTPELLAARPSTLDDELQRVIEARHHDPFSVLGKHPDKSGQYVIRALLPHAGSARVEHNLEMKRVGETALFICELDAKTAEKLPLHYTIHWRGQDGQEHARIDAYTFAPQLAGFDIHLFSEGRHWHIYRVLGAHPRRIDDVDGFLFAVWAPSAERVSVVGDFNHWDGRSHPMRAHGGSGVWELFIPGIEPDSLYKFEIRNRDSGALHIKSDPYATAFECRPQTASITASDSGFQWTDADWMSTRIDFDWQSKPVSIYEVHLGSWRQSKSGAFLNYRELAQQLVYHAKEMGFTHIELLPIAEHPLDASWGYQITGYFAATRRYGSADDFRYFVDYCHSQDIGVILDWVPAHFPKDAHGLARFDGSALYEHADPRRGEHRDWGTLIFNYGRNEVRNFLISNALYWMEEFHIDGLRVDAVASMLYLDYSRDEGDWIPNKFGGNENLEAIAFMREMNTMTHQLHPGTLMIAEESTAWPQVTRPSWTGGLGFSIKWNMGWMHDILSYLSKDPIHRHYHHDQLTFGVLYAFTENFILPFSHDEVVHGKGSMLRKSPGDEWRQFANLRLLYAMMFTYPGKKLLFMGNEFAQSDEWNHAKMLDWHLLNYPLHQGVKQLVSDLNGLYGELPALHGWDFDARGFEWIDCHDSSQSVLSYIRRYKNEHALVVLNFTPIPRRNYRIGVPHAGTYVEIFNSDSRYYGGSDVGNAYLTTENHAWMGRPYSLNMNLPPLGGIILVLDTPDHS